MQPLLLLLAIAHYPLLVALQPLLVALQRQERQEEQRVLGFSQQEEEEERQQGLERLRYSPTNSKNINLYLNTLNKQRFFKNKLINVRLT